MHVYKPADHLWVQRPGYEHHGILVYPGHVVHFAKHEPSGELLIQVGKLWEDFAQGATPQIVVHPNPSPDEVVLQRAHVSLNTSGYTVWGNNCEHFAHWCKTGEHKSKQVERGVKTLMAGAAAGATYYLSRTLWEVLGKKSRAGKCKALLATGKLCRNGALPGNYGYCGVHRR